MAKNRQDNRSDTDLVVHSLTVMGSMKGAGIRAIRDSVRMLQNAQTTLAEKTRDYWTAIASDNVITPDEKKTLWKEWKVLVQEYADLVQSAEEEHQISQVADPLIAYKAAYLTLYTLVVTNLKLFDNMRQNTQLSDRTAFIAAYTDYFAARDALRDAIRDGEDVRVEQVARNLAAQAQEQIRQVSLGGMAAASVDYARYGTGLEQRLTQITEAGSNAAFLGLSVGIPYFLTASAYDEWARLLINDPAGLEYLYNIYERVQTTSGGTGGSSVYFYRMKVSATDAQVKSLKNKLLVLDALRSVITLDADLVQIHGDSVFSSDTTIEKSVKDYIGKSIAKLLMGSDESDAGFDGTTIINGGFIKTDLIKVTTALIDEIMANTLTVKNKIVSENFYNSAGQVSGDGWGIFADGTAIFNDLTARVKIYSGDVFLADVAPGENVLFSLYVGDGPVIDDDFISEYVIPHQGTFRLSFRVKFDHMDNAAAVCYKNGSEIFRVSGTNETIAQSQDVLFAVSDKITLSVSGRPQYSSSYIIAYLDVKVSAPPSSLTYYILKHP